MPKIALDPKTFSLKNYIGEDVAITPVELRAGIVCKKGTPDEYKADAYKAHVTILTGYHAGSNVKDTLLFGQAVVSRLSKAANGEDLPLVCTPTWVESQNLGADGKPRVYLALVD
jgi:hypothetical protein